MDQVTLLTNMKKWNLILDLISILSATILYSIYPQNVLFHQRRMILLKHQTDMEII